MHAELADDREDHVLRIDARTEFSGHFDASHLRPRQRQTLGCEHVAHLARADTERHGAERAVRRGVAVAARDRGAGLGEPELGADHVHDPLLSARRLEEPDAVLGAIALERHEHLLGERIEQRPALRLRRDDVINGGEGAVRKAHRQTHLAQHREGLRAGDLVDQVQADEELGVAARQLAHAVRVPDLVEQVLAVVG